MELTDVVNQTDMTAIYRTFHPNTKYTLFSAPHWTFSKMYYILSHKTSLNRYKKIEITPCTIPDHQRLKIDINNDRNNRTPTTYGNWTTTVSSQK